LKDGRTLLSMTASGKEEIKAWVMSFGSKAEVLSPTPIREEIKLDLSRTLVHYKP
jgi:predicted DNA-binding transcriptional regulator YafY